VGFGGMERGANWGGPIHMRQMAGDPIETAHEPKANESHKMSGAINYSPQANQDTLDNLIWTTLGLKYGHHQNLHVGSGHRRRAFSRLQGNCLKVYKNRQRNSSDLCGQALKARGSLIGGGAAMMRFSTSPDEIANSPKGWVVEYGHLSIDCRDEEDAKRVVRNLRRRKGRIVARTAFGVSPRRWFEGEDLTKWLSGSPS